MEKPIVKWIGGECGHYLVEYKGESITCDPGELDAVLDELSEAA